MQQRLADLKELNRPGSSRWEQFIALDLTYRPKWENNRKKTRRYCYKCDCVLYVRSETDTVTDEKDLDEIYYSLKGGVCCFRCSFKISDPSIRFTPKTPSNK